MMNKNKFEAEKKNLITLLLLLMILSMYLALNIRSLPENLNGLSVMEPPKSMIEIIIVPVAMGIALLFSAVRAKNRSFKYILLISIFPFVISNDVIYFCNPLLILVVNIGITFLIILIILQYITSTYAKS